MQEVVCYNCGRIVHISPDAELCSVCGENLRELLHPVYASKYFYDRAAKLAAGSELLPALQEIDRGLSYQPSSELRLLGAILSKRIGDFEQMRHHVAAIPVDDVLRPEGEWLLRSHQIRQRELRQASKAPGAPRISTFADNRNELPITIQQVQPIIATYPQQPSAKRSSYRIGVGLFVVISVLGSALLVRNPQVSTFLWGTTGETVRPINRTDAVAPTIELAEPVRQPAPAQVVDKAATTAVALPEPTPTPLLTPDVPENVVQATDSAAVAASTPGLAVGINAAQPFDLQNHLVQLGRIDLAQLEVAATFQGTVLSLQGIVPTFVARQTLIELSKSVAGVTTVSTVNLLLRPPATYIVQEGDTLWSIAYQLYGDVTKREILFEANQDLLPSPDALTVGLALKVPSPE